MKVLLVSNDDSRFTAVNSCLNEKFLDLSLVIKDNKSHALEAITSDGPFAFFMLDMKLEDDIESVIADMIDLAGERPVILCGGDKEIDNLSKSLLIKNEGTTVLKDLEDKEKIYQILSSALKWSNQNHFDQEVVKEDYETEYISLKVGNLYLYDSFPHNLYVKIGDKKYVLALEKKVQIYHSQIGKLVQRGIKLVYIEKDKHMRFLEYSIEKAQDFFQNNQDFNKKTIMAHLRCAAIIQDYLVNLGVTTTISKFIDNYLQHMIITLESVYHFPEALEHYNFKFESIISKSLITAYTCYYMMKELGWKSETTRKKFLLASIVQDAFLENDRMAQINDLEDAMHLGFTEDQIEIYKQHPRQIADVVRQLTQFPDIDFLIEQHHERSTRDGFPNRPPPSEIQVAVCVFIIATQFSRDVDGKALEENNFKKVMQLYKSQFNVGNFKEPLNALKEALAL